MIAAIPTLTITLNLTVDLLTSESMHAECCQALYTYTDLKVLLIAQAIFPITDCTLDRQTDTHSQTLLITLPTLQPL